jgi:HD superfamily phosphohydrolase
MLTVVNDQLVVEAKGIYSIEKFIIARRLMYWQVYLHKTVLSAECLLVNILLRAKKLALKKENIFCTPALHYFLYQQFSKRDFLSKPELLDRFAELDDYDIMTCIKVWTECEDAILSQLCKQLVNRELFKVELQSLPFKKEKINSVKKEIKRKYKLTDKEISYFLLTGNVTNDAYRADKIRINILFKDGKIVDIADASDQLSIEVISKTIKKYYLCYPK